MNFLRTILSLVFAGLFYFSSLGEVHYSFSEEAQSIYEDILTLKLDQASDRINLLAIQEPENYIHLLLANYVDCIRIFISEEKALFDQLEHHKKERLNKIKANPVESPYYRYVRGEILLHWAVVRLKFGQYFQAATELHKAYSLLDNNAEMFPNFLPNKKDLGVIHAVIGTIPDEFKWAIKILGMDGTIEQGKTELEEVIKKSTDQKFLFHDEAVVLYAYILLHLDNNGEKAWQLLTNTQLDYTNNPLVNFVFANIAIHTGRNDFAMEVLDQFPQDKQFYSIPYILLMKGVTKLHRLEPDANVPLIAFIENSLGKHYIKEAYQKLAWHFLIQGSKGEYQRYMDLCKKNGASVVDEDKSALREARSKETPNPDLLKARLLFDGGYYHQAYDYLATTAPKVYKDKTHQLEYYYRLGRINHQLKNYAEALHYYLYAIENGRNESEYFGCNAALMAGIIYESQQNYNLAKEYFELCLDMDPDEYKSSLHQKAKAGLNRLLAYSKT